LCAADPLSVKAVVRSARPASAGLGRLGAWPQELHQDTLANQEGRIFGADHHLDHSVVGPLGGIIGHQLAGSEDGGPADHQALEGLAGIGL